MIDPNDTAFQRDLYSFVMEVMQESIEQGMPMTERKRQVYEEAKRRAEEYSQTASPLVSYKDYFQKLSDDAKNEIKKLMLRDL